MAEPGKRRATNKSKRLKKFFYTATKTLSAMEFIRRFLLHALANGFKEIRPSWGQVLINK
jgi:hypothetical protein